MFSRSLWVLLILAGLIGCNGFLDGGVVPSACLEKDPNNSACCDTPDLHADHGQCCPEGMHKVSDVEHPDWAFCDFDQDAGADARVLAHPDAGEDTGADAP